MRRRGGGDDSHDIVPPDDLQSRDSDAIAQRLLRSDPEVLGLSVYVWNIASTAGLIAALRRQKRELVIVLGGPEVAYRPHESLWGLDADFIATGEGERPFLELINRLSAFSSCRDPLPGMASRLGHGGPGALVACLDDIPSPFRMEMIDIPPSGWVDLETLRGCPFSCSFCLYGKNLSGMRYFSLGRVAADIDWALEHGAVDLYMLDPTFNLPRGRCRELLTLLSNQNADHRAYVHVEARAEVVDDALARQFAQAGITSVEVGLQAVDPGALRLMNRRLGQDPFVEGCRRLRDNGIGVEIGIIIGLPGDTVETIRRTIAFVTQDLLGEISAYRLQVLPGTPYSVQASGLGLVHDNDPPYFVRRTATLTSECLDAVTKEVGDALEVHNAEYRKVHPPRGSEISEKTISKKHKKPSAA